MAAALYLLMRIWSGVYFIPAALRFESAAAVDPSEARRWIGLSLLRLPLVAGSAYASWRAGRRNF